MSATNLAVCIAPSIFHLSSPRSSSSSPRRRKTVGVPDVRELNENRAAYECLSCMVSNYETLFSVSASFLIYYHYFILYNKLKSNYGGVAQVLSKMLIRI